MAQPKCPQCQSVTIKKVSTIYECGVRTRSSNTSRVSFSKRSTTSFSTTSSTSISAKAAKCAPPVAKDFGGQVAGFIIVGIIGGIFFPPLFPVFLFPAIAAHKRGHAYRETFYYPLFDAWDHSYQCQRCDNVFLLYFNDTPYQSSNKTKNYFMWYLIASVLLIGAIAFSIIKDEKYTNQNSVSPNAPSKIEANQDVEDNIATLAKQKQITQSDEPDPTPIAVEPPKEHPYTNTESTLIDSSTIEKAAETASSESAS